MKFTVETEPLIRLLEMLEENNTAQRRKLAPLALQASRTSLRIEQGHFVGEIEANVWQTGACLVSAGRLLQALKKGRPTVNLTLELHAERLRVGSAAVPVLADFSPAPAALKACSLFFSTNIGMVASGMAMAV